MNGRANPQATYNLSSKYQILNYYPIIIITHLPSKTVVLAPLRGKFVAQL